MVSRIGPVIPDRPTPPKPPVRPTSSVSVAGRDANRVTADTAERLITGRNWATPAPSSGGVGAPAPAPSFGGGGGGGGSIDWRDAAYAAQIAAINRALADYETELGQRGQRYGIDYLTGLRELGYRPGEGFNAAIDIFKLPGMENQRGGTAASGLSAVQRAMIPVTGRAAAAGEAGAADAVAVQPGQWDYEGNFTPFSAAARGTRTTRDDFAGRGYLRSSDFAKTYADFQDRMQNQLNAMETGRARFFEDAAMDLSKQRATAEERRQQAQRDAVMRAAIMAAAG